MWMVYGSWSGGIFLLEIDEKTGLVIHPKEDEKTAWIRILENACFDGGHKSIEGPYILYDEESGYYYLFVSYGSPDERGRISDACVPLKNGGWRVCRYEWGISGDVG